MINIPKNIGTCENFTNALNLVYDLYEREINKDDPKKIVIFNDLINNSLITEELNKMGIETIYSLEDICLDDIVIISTYGTDEEVYNFLKNNNIEYYDTTCKKILNIRTKISEKYNDGYDIIIIGDKNHLEVENINKYCNNTAYIIKNNIDINKIPENNNKKFVVVETSFSKEKFIELSQLLEEKYPNITIENTLCDIKSKIKDESKSVSTSSDLMYIIGDIDNDDTKELYESIKDTTNTKIVNNLNDFYKEVMDSDIKIDQNIGITGSTSIPIKEIDNYKHLLSFLIFYKKILQDLKTNQDTINNKYKDESNEIITKTINDLIDLNSDGKYIRGCLIALGYYASTNFLNDYYLDLAYAYETFQTSILIHDDIIDNAKIRRGKETIPRRICREYLNIYNNKKYQEDVLKLANSLAICSGDLGFYLASNLINESYGKDKSYSELVKFYNDIVIKTIKGEILDVKLPFLGKYRFRDVEEKDIFMIYTLKTSWYTIIGPFFLGYILGGSKINYELKDILNKIGISFQIKDDLLGVFSSFDILGKSNTSDIEEFKQTILYNHIINTPYKEEFLKIYGKSNITKIDLLNIRNLLIESGSLEYAEDYLDNLNYEINESLDNLEIAENIKDILKGLIIYINIREK